MQSINLRRHKLTVTDYYKAGETGILKEQDRVELIEGEIIDMVPIGSRHAYTIDILTRTFVKQAADNLLIRIQQPIHLNQFNEPQPDLAIVADQNYSTNHPGPTDTLLLIEVADSSLSYDIDIKVPLYANHNIPEVWIIDLKNKDINVFQTPHQNAYQHSTRRQSGNLSPLKAPSITLDITSLWS